VLIALVFGAYLPGCTPGVKWRFGLAEDALADGRTQNKLTFVYFRSWASVDCTDFEEKVLKQPAVLEASASLVCVPLDTAVDRDRQLAERWQLRKVPAFAIVDPAGVVLESGSGAITRDSLLAAFANAKRKALSTTRPASPP
jgi:hypothetical protein